MSGRRRSSQLTSRGRRVRIELTFHVAIFMKAVIFYRIPGCFPTQLHHEDTEGTEIRGAARP